MVAFTSQLLHLGTQLLNKGGVWTTQCALAVLSTTQTHTVDTEPQQPPLPLSHTHKHTHLLFRQWRVNHRRHRLWSHCCLLLLHQLQRQHHYQRPALHRLVPVGSASMHQSWRSQRILDRWAGARCLQIAQLLRCVAPARVAEPRRRSCGGVARRRCVSELEVYEALPRVAVACAPEVVCSQAQRNSVQCMHNVFPRHACIQLHSPTPTTIHIHNHSTPTTQARVLLANKGWRVTWTQPHHPHFYCVPVLSWAPASNGAAR